MTEPRGSQKPTRSALRAPGDTDSSRKDSTKRRLSDSDLTKNRLGVLGTVRTESQVRHHEGFASGEVHVRDELGPLVSLGERTKQLARPPGWTEVPAIPCIPNVQNHEWTEAMKESHWEARTDRQAGEMCRGCDVLDTCLATALIEEKGLRPESRFLVRGGLTPKGRWLLDD